MTPTLRFDRDAVGVSAKESWGDADSFASIARSLKALSCVSSATDLPEGDNSGTAALRTALTGFVGVMTDVVLEYSDACAVLGSGQESAISDYDATEVTESEAFVRIHARME